MLSKLDLLLSNILPTNKEGIVVKTEDLGILSYLNYRANEFKISIFEQFTELSNKFLFIDADKFLFESEQIGEFELMFIWNKHNSKLLTDAIKNKLLVMATEYLVSEPMSVDGIRENFWILALKKQKAVNTRDKELAIVTVLRTGGGVYNATYVNNLYDSISKNLTVPHEFICLTNDSTGFSKRIKVIPLIHELPSYWCKIELFTPELFKNKQVVYFDLDTLIINNIDFMASAFVPFSGLRDFNHLVSLGSGVMCFDGDCLENYKVYTDFMNKPEHIIASRRAGDQEWIFEITRPYTLFLQDMFPDKIVSFKKHCYNSFKQTVNYPKTAAIVCFHGLPRIHEMTHPEVKKYWINIT